MGLLDGLFDRILSIIEVFLNPIDTAPVAVDPTSQEDIIQPIVVQPTQPEITPAEPEPVQILPDTPSNLGSLQPNTPSRPETSTQNAADAYNNQFDYSKSVGLNYGSLKPTKDGNFGLNYDALNANGTKMKYGGNPIQGDSWGRVDSYIGSSSEMQNIASHIEDEANRGLLNPPTSWAVSFFQGMLTDAQTIRGAV